LSREEFTVRVKKAALKRANGKCDGCGQPLKERQHQCDHIKPARLGGTATLENAQILCLVCHRIKNREDNAIMRKADAQKAQANGLKAPKKKFGRPPKPEKVSKPLPPRRSMFKEKRQWTSH
jgi:5-methylcytosine-specific restriction endonuclease McrA